MLAIAIWSIAAAVLLLGHGYRDINGKLIGTDFVHFYTMGQIARTGPARDLIDADAIYRRQLALVPESEGEHYLPNYPLQTYFLFVPLSYFPYLVAWGIWGAIVFATYAFTLWLAWRPWRDALRDRVMLIAGGAAFPPLVYLVFHGQTTPIVITAFGAGAAALARGHKLLAGIAFGMLFFKPQFGLMLAIVVLACGESAMLTGAVIAAITQIAALVLALGTTVVIESWQRMARFAFVHEVFEPIPWQLHSLATLTHLLPRPLDLPVWIALCAVVGWLTVRVWRRRDLPVDVRAGVLVLSSVLVSPHVLVYDLAVLAAPLLSVGGWLAADRVRLQALGRRWWFMVYLLFALVLFPTARLIRLQLSVILMTGMVYSVSEFVSAHPRQRDNGR